MIPLRITMLVAFSAAPAAVAICLAAMIFFGVSA
jgi:hypothetical protein